MSLKTPTSKMSKSDPAEGSRILLSDSDDQIASKIKKATMDSITGISYDTEKRHGVANLIHIMSCATGQSPSEISQSCSTDSNQKFKEKVKENVIGLVKPIREEMARLKKDLPYVQKVLEMGEEKARAKAEETMKEVKRVVGL
jgi:tryptophanyl-tRNA synthetase